MELNKIYNEDCLEGMKRIADNSVDLVVTDPPYKLISGGCRGSIDIVFNNASYEQKSSGQLFEIPNFYSWFKEVYRVMKDGSHFYCMINDKNMQEVLNVAQQIGLKELNILVWDKGMHTPLGYYMKNIEFIVLFRKGYAKKINNMGSKALISIKGIRGDKVHVSEKPVTLMEHLILNSSNEGEVVLDPFMGSGTTAVACLNTNRNFIGFELDENYHKIACERVAEWYNNKTTL